MITNQTISQPALIALMMEAASTFERLADFHQTTRRYNPEDSHLQTTGFHEAWYEYQATRGLITFPPYVFVLCQEQQFTSASK
jgi:hypothetical protein